MPENQVFGQTVGGIAFVQENEIFLSSCTKTAISGQGCPEKPLLSPDGESRVIA